MYESPSVPVPSEIPDVVEGDKMSQKMKRLENVRSDVDLITDAVGNPIEAGVKETVVALNISEINTTQSCHGHEEVEGGHRLWPWVDVGTPNEPEERFQGENKLFEDAAQKYGVDIEILKRGGVLIMKICIGR